MITMQARDIHLVYVPSKFEALQGRNVPKYAQQGGPMISHLRERSSNNAWIGKQYTYSLVQAN